MNTRNIKNVKINDIKKEARKRNVSFSKAKMYLNGNDAYYVDDKLYTVHEMKEAFLLDLLL